MDPLHVAITGASGGLGRALVQQYARPGARLLLFGRDAARLEAAASEAAAAGAEVETVRCDAAEAAAVSDAVLRADGRLPLDVMIAAAGLSSGGAPEGGPEPHDAALEVLRVNVLGAAAAAQAALAVMRPRRRGRIGLIGSLAARPPLPFAPAYSASKAAVETYGAALRGACAAEGVSVTVVSPGFFSSPMSDRVLGPRPFMASTERAAQIVREAVDAGRGRVAFPWPLALACEVAALLPPPLQRLALRPMAFRVRPR